MGLLEYILMLGVTTAAMVMVGFVGYCAQSGKDSDGTRWLATGILLMCVQCALLFNGYLAPLLGALYGMLNSISSSNTVAAITAGALFLVLVAMSITTLLGLGYFVGTRLVRSGLSLKQS